MGKSLGPAVVFDFTGSLELARRLWSMADELDALLGLRRTLGTEALAHWQGVYAVEFVERLDDELTTGSTLVGQLRGEAGGWATEWQKAMDQENWNRYAAAVQRVEDGRGWGDKIGGFFTGHDDLPPTPTGAGLPAASNFLPTRSFANYSAY